MYHALVEGKSTPVEKLRWVKLQSNGIYVNCTEAEGQGIIIDGEIYHVYGREQIDKPTVDLVWQDDVTALKEENTLLKAQVSALSGRGEFIEDVIAEMAMQVYE